MTNRTTVNISLTPELEEFVNTCLASGRYQTVSEVVREALRLLEKRHEPSWLETMSKRLEAGITSLSQLPPAPPFFGTESISWPISDNQTPEQHLVAENQITLLPGAQFSLSFDPELSEFQIVEGLNALADYYRACGGFGLQVTTNIRNIGPESVHTTNRQTSKDNANANADKQRLTN